VTKPVPAMNRLTANNRSATLADPGEGPAPWASGLLLTTGISSLDPEDRSFGDMWLCWARSASAVPSRHGQLPADAP
jgi:hypothetical protein